MVFLLVCASIKFPVAEDKTEYAQTQIVFLGMLLEGSLCLVVVPEETEELINKCKATVKELQCFASFLNFLNKAVVPGRILTRCMYAKFANTLEKPSKLKVHHHIYLDVEFRNDCKMWRMFLSDPRQFAQPFVDFEKQTVTVQEILFEMDASCSTVLGFGCRFRNAWTFSQWEPKFID